MVQDLITKYEKKGVPVAGLIIEPIQAEGGDHHGSAHFYQQLRKICTANKVAYIIDEVQTGGGPTGKFWAHEWFEMDPPDIVTFSKKMLIGGFYYKQPFRPDKPYRIFNTWLGDPSKLLLLDEVVKIVKSEGLLAKVTDVGKYLLDGLLAVAKESPDLVSNARGRGTFCALDFKTPELRDKAVKVSLLFIVKLVANSIFSSDSSPKWCSLWRQWSCYPSNPHNAYFQQTSHRCLPGTPTSNFEAAQVSKTKMIQRT